MTTLVDIPEALALAKSLSKHSDFRRFPIGAVLYRRGKVIGTGFNTIKSHPCYSFLSTNPYATSTHAEVRTILNSGISVWVNKFHRLRIKNPFSQTLTLVIARYTKRGTPALAKPCKSCMRLIREVGIHLLVYTINEKPGWKLEEL